MGVTHECDWPPEADGKPLMTRPTLDLRGASNRAIDRRVQAAVEEGHALYEIDEAALRAARPDLIISQQLCAVCAPHHASVQELARDKEQARANAWAADQGKMTVVK